MTQPPLNVTPVRFVAGPDAQPADAGMAGQIVLVPEGYPLGSGPTSPGRLLGVYGWTQVNPTGDPQLEWLMGSLFDTATVAAFNAIPPDGWRDPAQRTVYRQMGVRLIEAGIAVADVRNLLRVLYRAAKANEEAGGVR